jgi:hypothetical protein
MAMLSAKNKFEVKVQCKILPCGAFLEPPSLIFLSQPDDLMLCVMPSCDLVTTKTSFYRIIRILKQSAQGRHFVRLFIRLIQILSVNSGQKWVTAFCDFFRKLFVISLEGFL